MLLTVLVCLATYRATRFLTEDSFPPIAWARRTIRSYFGEDHWVSYLVKCPWCVSVYVGAGIMALTSQTTDLRWPWLVWPAASAVTGLISKAFPEESPPPEDPDDLLRLSRLS